jgi:hypothetical protein
MLMKKSIHKYLFDLVPIILDTQTLSNAFHHSYVKVHTSNLQTHSLREGKRGVNKLYCTPLEDNRLFYNKNVEYKFQHIVQH